MLLCWQGWCIGQQTFTVTGIDVSGGNGKMSVTVGQFDYGMLTDGDINLISGVQQPFDIVVPTGTDPLAEAVSDFNLYPNPATRVVILRNIGEKTGGLFYRLVDSDGKELQKAPILETETLISLDNYKASVYFIILMNHFRNLKTFKIIKN